METIIDCGTNKVMCDAAMTFLKAQWPVLFEKELFVVVNDSPCFAINASSLGERLVELHMVKTHMDAWKAGWEARVPEPYLLEWNEGQLTLVLQTSDEPSPEWYTLRNKLREENGLSEDEANRAADAEYPPT